MVRRRTVPVDHQGVPSPRRINVSTTSLTNGIPPPPDYNIHDYGKRFEYNPDFNGPAKNRSCTDIICLLLFLVFLGGWGFVAYIGFTQGDIEKVRLRLLNFDSF